MLRETPLPKSPTTLTNEQVEAWMKQNPDRVKRLDNTDYDHSVVKRIAVKPNERKRVKPLDNKTIQQAMTKNQRKASTKVPISFGTKTKRSAKAETKKPKIAKKGLDRLQRLAKRRSDWLRYLQVTGWPMTSREVREMFGISNPRFTAERINQDGEHIAISKELYNNRKTLLFTAIKKDKQ